MGIIDVWGCTQKFPYCFQENKSVFYMKMIIIHTKNIFLVQEIDAKSVHIIGPDFCYPNSAIH